MSSPSDPADEATYGPAGEPSELSKDGSARVGAPSPGATREQPTNLPKPPPERAYPALMAALRPSAAAPAEELAPRGGRLPHQARIRPPVARRTEPAASAALAEGADVALYGRGDDGSPQFDIALDEGLLGQLRCRLRWTQAGLEATFVVEGSPERWLIDGRMGELRAQLEQRGLKVASIAVVDRADERAPRLLTDLVAR